MGDPNRLGSLGGRAIGLYIGTTIIAATLGLAFGTLFKPGVGIRLISFFGKLSGYLPNFLKDFLSFAIPKVPSNMTGRTIGAIAMLHSTAEPLYQELQKMENASIKTHNRPLHPYQIYEHLDEVERKSNGKIGYLSKN